MVQISEINIAFVSSSLTASCTAIGRLLADLADVDGDAGLFRDLLAGLLGHLGAFFSGHCNTLLFGYLFGIQFWTV